MTTPKPPSGTTLGQGFRLLAQAVVEVAQQLKIMNQLTVLRAHADYDDASVATMHNFRAIDRDLFPAPATPTPAIRPADIRDAP